MAKNNNTIPDGVKIWYIRDKNNHPIMCIATRIDPKNPSLCNRATSLCSPMDDKQDAVTRP